MDHEEIKLTQAHLINSDTLSVCFSDGTVAAFSPRILLACAVKRIPSEECFNEDHLAFLHSSMPEGKLKLAIADNLRSLAEKFSG